MVSSHLEAIQGVDDDSAYFVRLLIDKVFLSYTEDENLQDLSFQLLFERLEMLVKNENFIEIVMHEVDLKFGDKAIALNNDSLENAEKLFKQSVGSNDMLMVGAKMLNQSFQKPINVSD